VRALPPDVAQRLRIVAVDLDPEHVEIGERLEDLKIALGLGIEVEIEKQIDIASGPLAHRQQMRAQVAQDVLVDIDSG
jgi:hypothetical protein